MIITQKGAVFVFPYTNYKHTHERTHANNQTNEQRNNSVWTTERRMSVVQIK